MKTKTINLYSFKELNEKAQKRVLEEYRDINVDYAWYDFIFDDWKEKLSRLGFMDAEIHFSGFYSQGDGACFDASIDTEKFCKGYEMTPIEGMELTISKNSYAAHYSHSNTRFIDGNLQHGVMEKMTDYYRGFCREIYRELEKAYENLTSDDAIIETFEANEYTFRENGVMENE